MAETAGPPAEDPFASTRMTLGEHLGELRTRLFRGAFAVLAAFVVAIYYDNEIIEIVRRPFNQVTQRLNEDYRAEAERRAVRDPALRSKYFEPDGDFRYEI